VILASASPRRRALLGVLLPDFSCQAADIDEAPRWNEAPSDYVCRMAEEKAAKVWIPGSVVLGADTTVVYQNRILHKPSSFADAEGMLRSLSGLTHDVMTSVTLMSDALVKTELVVTQVEFAELSPELIAEYLATQEPWDKAGAYGIQGLAGSFVKRLDGSYTGVVGLPLAETRVMLESAGVETRLGSAYV
jgi:septum formation protein